MPCYHDTPSIAPPTAKTAPTSRTQFKSDFEPALNSCAGEVANVIAVLVNGTSSPLLSDEPIITEVTGLRLPSQPFVLTPFMNSQLFRLLMPDVRNVAVGPPLGNVVVMRKVAIGPWGVPRVKSVGAGAEPGKVSVGPPLGNTEVTAAGTSLGLTTTLLGLPLAPGTNPPLPLLAPGSKTPLLLIMNQLAYLGS